jgi:tyrosyl-tRNA synthetase
MEAKFELAAEITARFHTEADAKRAHQAFIDQFRKGEVPNDMPEVVLEPGEEGLPVSNMLKLAGMVSSTSDARRMIDQGAVKFDGERITDPTQKLPAGTSMVVQVGKRKWAKVSIEK